MTTEIRSDAKLEQVVELVERYRGRIAADDLRTELHDKSAAYVTSRLDSLAELASGWERDAFVAEVIAAGERAVREHRYAHQAHQARLDAADVSLKFPPGWDAKAAQSALADAGIAGRRATGLGVAWLRGALQRLLMRYAFDTGRLPSPTELAAMMSSGSVPPLVPPQQAPLPSSVDPARADVIEVTERDRNLARVRMQGHKSAGPERFAKIVEREAQSLARRRARRGA